jgi:hypothetical protein
VSDPERWLDGSEELSPEERRVLGSDQGGRSPLGAKAAVWGVLAAKVSVVGTAAAASSGATASLSALSLAKLAGVGMVLGSVVSTGLYFGGERGTRTEASVVQAPLVAPSARAAKENPAPAERTETREDTDPAVPESTEPAPSGRPPSRAGAARTESGDVPFVAPPPLENESQRVARARALLRSGDAPSALGVLRALERDEPSGLLAQERESLLIEGLRAVGQRESAQRRAVEFLARYPTSPHAAAVRRAAE